MFFGSNKRKYEFENVSIDSRISNEILMSLTSFLKQSDLTFTNWFEDAVGHFIANPVKPELGFLELSSDAVILQSLTEDTVRIVDGDAHMYNMSIFEEEDGRVNLTLVRYEDPAVEVLYSTDDDDGTSSTVVPFQVAYAVSIHKAQGLEYESVKIVITDEVDELITHNIFYTAITRARKKLKIYWTPEVEKKVLDTIKPRNNSKDVHLLKTI